MTYELYLAALKLGIAIIPSSEMLRTKDLQYRITHGEIKAVIAKSDFIEEFKGVKEYDALTKFIIDGHETDWINIEDEKASQSDALDIENFKRRFSHLIIYIWNDRNPKAVTHSHGWDLHENGARTLVCIKEDDLVWATAAPGWQNGYGVLSYQLWVQAQQHLFIMVNSTLLVILNYYKAFEINVLCCTPTEYRMMAKLDNLQEYNLEHLHSVVSAGEPLNREVVEQFRNNFNLTVRDGYGQTESTLLIGFFKSRPGSMGKEIPGSRVTIVDDEDNRLKQMLKEI